ncbi:MAG: hypothetical protein HS111_10455 [Kofleriaceae bacterium]|nr:hypothetical protein [Kofleriaceae bacterium]
MPGGEEVSNPAGALSTELGTVAVRPLLASGKQGHRSAYAQASLCAAECLDEILRARTDDNGLPFSWYEWGDVLPAEVPRMRPEARLRWTLGTGAATVGSQQRLAAVEAILIADAATVAASMPSMLYRLAPTELAALRDEEAAMLVAS